MKIQASHLFEIERLVDLSFSVDFHRGAISDSSWKRYTASIIKSSYTPGQGYFTKVI